MAPVFAPGDHVLTFNWGEIKAGDVIVFRSSPSSLRGSPSQSGRRSNLKGSKYGYFIKRIDKFVDNYVYVSGDNKKSAKKIEPFDKEHVVGKVILKY